MRVAVLAGGRSSEHEVSLDSAASVRDGRRRGRARGAGGDDRALGRVDVSTASRSACGPAAGCSAPTPCSACCTGRSARTGRCRACWSCSTCPTSAPACSPPRCAWTRWSSRRCWPPRAVPQVPYAGVREPRWRAEPDARPARAGRARHAGVRQAGAARLVGRDRQGAVGVRARPRRSTTAFEHDGLVIVEGFSDGMEVECSVLGNLDPAASVPGEIVLNGADWYDYEAKYTPGAMELVVPARLPEPVLDEVRRLAVRHVPARRLRRPGAGRLLRRGRRARARQRAQHDARVHGHERVPEAVGGVRHAVPGALRPPAARSRSSASRPNAARTRSRPRPSGAAGSRRSRRARRPGPSFVIQTR